MKKFMLVFCILLLTGCKNEFKCKLETTEQNYDTEQIVTVSFKENMVKEVKIDYIMIFEDKETATSYLETFESLKSDYDMNFKDNKLTLTKIENYEDYDQNKDELKQQFELDGYICN